MPDNSTAEIETKEEKPLARPLQDSDSIQGTTYNGEVLAWIAHNNKKSDTQHNNQPEKDSA